MDLVAVHHSEQKLNTPQHLSKFLFFVFTWVWNDPSGACVLHPEWKLTFLVCMGAHGRAWMVSVMPPKAVRMGLR